ncbi:MAG: hypothetical protein KAV87_45500 [Desulfobacteraceae bacterium]|nr:hypothetical protein [Desulfobacteraceae bacterium]
MPDCELLATCPFFAGGFQEIPELTERLREEYCHGEYSRCGRYQAYKAMERDRETENLKIASATRRPAYIRASASTSHNAGRDTWI